MTLRGEKECHQLFFLEAVVNLLSQAESRGSELRPRKVAASSRTPDLLFAAFIWILRHFLVFLRI